MSGVKTDTFGSCSNCLIQSVTGVFFASILLIKVVRITDFYSFKKSVLSSVDVAYVKCWRLGYDQEPSGVCWRS